MNFLSHFYFERFSVHPERIVGCVLPDLLKNADKSYVFHPQRFEEQLFAHPLSRELSEGWYRHVEVDKAFHSSEMFLEHCHLLRDRKSTRLNSSHVKISYAVFCLKKKTQ